MDRLSGSYAYDTTGASSPGLNPISKAPQDRFDIGPDASLPLEFTGSLLFKYSHTSDLSHDLHSGLHERDTFRTDATFSNFRSVRMMLTGLSHPRSGILCDVAMF